MALTPASEEELKQLLPDWAINKMNKIFHATSTMIFDNLLPTSIPQDIFTLSHLPVSFSL